MDHVRQKLMITRVRSGRRHARGAGRLLLLGLFIGCAACGTSDGATGFAGTLATDSVARARQDSTTRAQPGYVVDSILPVEEGLQRFRAAAGGAPAATLRDGSASRAALVTRVMQALAAADTRALIAMTLDAREFADLVYPESRYTRPPFRQAPALVWAQVSNASRTGLTRLVRRTGGLELRLISHQCDTAPQLEGRNRLWTRCSVTIADPRGRVETHRLFGSIVERDGRFKIVSWAGEF